jgi:signal transduction histidine kinase
MIRFNMPKLRIYQQILICFGLIVSLPLLGVTFIINSINQQAMKKELARFTEHTAEALYRDFGTEMSWQKQQSHMMAQLMTDELGEGKNFNTSSRQILGLDPDLDAVGLYDKEGHLLKTYYRDFQNLSPELRLPDALEQNQLNPNAATGPPQTVAPDGDTGKTAETAAANQPFQVIYSNSGSPQDSPYYLRATIPVSRLKHPSGAALSGAALAHAASGSGISGRNTPNGSPSPGNAATGEAAYYVQQKNFPYLRSLVRSNNSLYDAFYIIDSDGIIIAGPLGADRQERISPEDYKQFVKISPGVTHQFSSTPQSDYDGENRAANARKDTDDPPPLKKVIVKMPAINWGIIIESPYHVKQKYIKQAGVNTFLLILGCLAMMILMVLPYILGISRNFRQLIKGVKAVGEGNYFRRIRLITNYFTPYEIVYLTLEFNRMARKTADSWQAIQEANRKLAQMDEFKSNLIDTVSHELRTPLTSIKGYTSRLLRYDSSLDAETRIKSLKVVKQQADRLSRLVEDLLVIPDLETARLRVYPDQVALLPLLENSVQFIQARYSNEAERDIRLVLAPDVAESQSVLADPDRLEQIVLNLLDNAVKYSCPDTPIELLVEREFPEAETVLDGKIALSVVNTCEPIPLHSSDELESLFEKFKRLDDSLVRTTRGSGLGLYITRELIEAMSGEIRLFHDNGRFMARFTIPIDTTEAIETAESGDRPEDAAIPL